MKEDDKVSYTFTRYKKIEHNSKVVLVNDNTGQWIRMSNTVFEIISLAIERNLSESELLNMLYDDDDRKYISQIINKLLKLELIINKSQENVVKSNRKYIMMELTRRCNLNCIHCCVNANENNKDLSTADIKLILTKIVKFNPTEISLTGGEPLIREDFFDILNYLRSIYNGKIALSTNGTLINEENVKKIINSVNQIDISIDGVDEDSCKVVRGPHVFEKIMNSIKLLKKYNFNNISLSIVIGNKNRNLKGDFLELSKRLEVKPVIRSFASVGRGKENNSIFEYTDKSKYLEENFSEENFSLKHTKKIMASSCKAAKEILNINYKGDIYPCHCFADSIYKIGNMLDENVDEYFYKKTKEVIEKVREYHPNNFEKCKNCDVNLFCWPCPGELKIDSSNKVQFNKVCEKIKPILYKYVWGE